MKKDSCSAYGNRLKTPDFSPAIIRGLLILLLPIFLVSPVTAAEKVSLQLRWTHGFQFAGYYLAQEKGFYQQAGLDVTFLEGGVGIDTVERVLSGTAEFGVDSNNLVLARTAGQPVVILAVIFQHSPYALIVRTAADIHSPHDLIGHKIQLAPMARIPEIMAMLLHEGVPLDAIEISPPPTTREDMQNPEIAGFSAYLSNEPFILQELGIDYRLLRPLDYGIAFYGDSLFAAESEINQHPERSNAFLEASLKGWRYALAHPDETVALIQQKYNPEQRRAAHLRYEYETLKTLIQPEHIPLGQINPYRWQRIAELYAALGLIDGVGHLEGFVYDPTKAKFAHQQTQQRILIWGLAIALSGFAILGLWTGMLRRLVQVRTQYLWESQARLQSILDHLPGLIFIKDLTGCYRLINRHCERLLHLKNEEIQGKITHEVFPKALADQWVAHDQQVLDTGQPQTVEESIPQADGVLTVLSTQFLLRDASGTPNALCSISIDITERKRAEAALQASEEQYRAVIETSPDGFWITDLQGRLLEVNEAYARLSGYSCAELRTMTVADLEARENPAETTTHINRVIEQGNDLFQTQHRTKSGRVWQAEVNAAYWPIAGGRLFVFLRDTRRRQRSEALINVRMRLSDLAHTGSLNDLLQAALDTTERFTGSLISFFHFLGPDQETLTLQTWSTHTLTHLWPRSAPSDPPSWPDREVWADCIRRCQPIIHNDYARPPDRKGLPEGHARVIRQLTVPILRNDRVIAIIGVGNKPDDYTADDIEVVQQLADLLIDVVERKRVEEQIEYLAYHDALTQLPNRVLLTDRLQQAMAQTERDQKRLAVCYLDLDGFKPINDTWGQTHGDRVLIEVAQRLKTGVRAGDTVARLGGDEFVLLLGDLADVEECEHALDRVIAALRVPFTIAGSLQSLTASLGITLYPDDDVDPDTLLRHTDQAMYAAKQAGGNRYHWFDADYDRRARRYRESLQRIEEGLAAGEFRLYYQPQVDMRQGLVVGAEALIRWQHPEEGLLPPARFMPAVEASDLAIAVGRWVTNEALRQMTVWAAQGLRLPVSINISSRHLQQPDFVIELQAALAAYPDVPPHGLELEILETVALEDMATISHLIERCRQLGVRFALDDFGTGYSSLTYLKTLAVHLLKIDQSFVRDLLVDPEARAIVEGVIGLAVAFRRRVIAEGVETDEQGDLLIGLGCHFAQGYGIARPMPPEQIPAWIATWTAPSAWTRGAGS